MASAPGWYPDPDGTGGQRYFDGTNWGPKAPPPASPSVALKDKTVSGKAIIWIIAGIVFLIFLIGRCGSDDNPKSEDSRSRTGTSTSTTASRSPSATVAPTPTGPKKPDASFTSAPGPDGEEVTAAFAIGDNFTEGLIKDGARFETIDILEYAKATYPNASQVTVQGSFPMKDAYGNTSTDVILNVTYLRSTLDQINFAGVDKDKIWEIRDSGFIHPELQP